MGYYLYKKVEQGNKASFTKCGPTNLAGNRKGIIVKYIEKKFLSDAGKIELTSPFAWEMPLAEAIESLGLNCNSLVVDLKPNDKKVVALYELLALWGYSVWGYGPEWWGWTPIMLKLRGIVVDDDAEQFSRQNNSKEKFTVEPNPDHACIYTFLRLDGSFNEDGRLEGTWNFPGPGATNSALLWPDAFKFFVSKAGDGC